MAVGPSQINGATESEGGLESKTEFSNYTHLELYPLVLKDVLYNIAHSCENRAQYISLIVRNNRVNQGRDAIEITLKGGTFEHKESVPINNREYVLSDTISRELDGEVKAQYPVRPWLLMSKALTGAAHAKIKIDSDDLTAIIELVYINPSGQNYILKCCIPSLRRPTVLG